MRVLLLSPSAPPRGVLRSLTHLGVEPIVVRPSGENEHDGQVQYVRVPSRGDASDPADLRWSRRALRTVIRDIGPQLIHIVADPWTPTAEVGAAASRDLKIPYVLVGTSSRGGPTGLTGRWQADRIRSGAAAIGGTVRTALDHLIGLGRDERPSAILPNGGVPIPAPWQPRPDPERTVIFAVGRLIPERGIDLLLEALGTIQGDWRLRIAGTGPQHEELELQAQRLGLSSRIEWLGAVPRERIVDLWREADVVVAPSRSTPSWVEPTGAVVLQAMAWGVAPIVSRCGALPDVVADGGLIVEENDLSGLNRALAGVIAEPWRARAIGGAARQRVLEQFGDRSIADRMVDLWQRTLAVV